jgi:hypothetical protein
MPLSFIFRENCCVSYDSTNSSDRVITRECWRSKIAAMTAPSVNRSVT